MLNRNIKLISVAIMFVSAIMVMGGCGLLDMNIGANGVPHTPLTDAMGTAGDVGKGLGMIFPAAAGIGGLISIIANGILGVVVKKKAATGGKLDTALTVTVAGVNAFVTDFDKAKAEILSAVKELPVDGKTRIDIETALGRIGSVKDTVSAYATDEEIYAFLRMFIKIAEAKDRA